MERLHPIFFPYTLLDLVAEAHSTSLSSACGVGSAQSVSSSGTSAVDHVELVLRVKVPDAHSDCPLGEKYGAIEEICSELVSLFL